MTKKIVKAERAVVVIKEAANKRVRQLSIEEPHVNAKEIYVVLRFDDDTQLYIDLSSRHVRWIADEEGDGAGYDVLSFTPTGVERLLEVKTINGSARTPFFLSRNELEVSKEKQENWRIYRVHFFATSPRIFTLAPPLDGVLHLRSELWRASF